MANLAMIVVARDAAEAQMLGTTHSVSDTALDVQGLEFEAVAALNDVVTGSGYQSALRALAPADVDRSVDQWTRPFAAELTARLAGASVEELVTWAAVWSSCSETDSWEDDEIARLMPRLALAAREALETGEQLYLWISL